VFLNSYIPSASISPDNRQHTAVPAILFESLKGHNNEKCLGRTNPLIRPCSLVVFNNKVQFVYFKINYVPNYIPERVGDLISTIATWV
jgi:hypothetical protein